MPTSTSDSIILVTGATGRQGGAVARRLLEIGWQVRILTRNGNSSEAQGLKRMGAEVHVGDLSKPESLTAAVAGAHGVFSVQDFWQCGYRGEIEQGQNLARVAKEANVQHFIYSSVGGTDRTIDKNIPHFDSKRTIETYVRDSGIPFTIFRPVTFFENFITKRYQRDIPRGVFQFSILPEKPFQMLAVEDQGIFVEQAFAKPDSYLGQSLEIASDALTMREFAAALSVKLGRTIQYRKMSDLKLRVISTYIGLTGTSGYYHAGKELIPMFNWLNDTRGWDADIPALKSRVPNLKTMQQWVDASRWIN